MAKTRKRAKGDLGEDIACKYLKRLGYKVILRNYWRPWGEIDIVGLKDNTIHFVEVKTVSREYNDTKFSRESDTGIHPEENLHAAKLERLHRIIQTYLFEEKVPNSKNWQIDLASVYLDILAKKAKVELLENIIM